VAKKKSQRRRSFYRSKRGDFLQLAKSADRGDRGGEWPYRAPGRLITNPSSEKSARVGRRCGQGIRIIRLGNRFARGAPAGLIYKADWGRKNDVPEDRAGEASSNTAMENAIFARRPSGHKPRPCSRIHVPPLARVFALAPCRPGCSINTWEPFRAGRILFGRAGASSARFP